MKKFLAVFTGSLPPWTRGRPWIPPQREQKERAGMTAWKEWAATHAKDIVDQGSPLGKTRQVSAKGIADIRNNLGAWTVVQAESQDAAARMFEKHPHFMLFPGEAVEGDECLPMPEGV